MTGTPVATPGEAKAAAKTQVAADFLHGQTRFTVGFPFGASCSLRIDSFAVYRTTVSSALAIDSGALLPMDKYGGSHLAVALAAATVKAVRMLKHAEALGAFFHQCT